MLCFAILIFLYFQLWCCNISFMPCVVKDDLVNVGTPFRKVRKSVIGVCSKDFGIECNDKRF